MQCPKCNALVDDSQNVCPNCGQPLGTNNEQEDVVVITENMAPPELLINQENMGAGVGDLSTGEGMSSYSPEEQTPTEEVTQTIPDRVDFSIPKVTAPSTENVPTDGSVPVIEGVASTVKGETSKEDVTKLKIGGKVLKIKMGRKLGLPLVIIIALLTLLMGVFIGKMLFSKNYCVSTTRSQTINTKVKYVSDGKK